TTASVVIEDLSAYEDPITALYTVTQHYQTHLNLQKGPLTYLVVLKWPQEARVFWCIHHLAVDGVSWRILREDLQTAYQQTVTGQRVQLPAKTSSFKAWAEYLTEYAASDSFASEFAYWHALPTCSLPIDHKASENRVEHHQDYTITLSHSETDALLKQVPVAYNTRINDVLLTALAFTLTEWTGTNQCFVDVEGHGRVTPLESNALDVSRTVGWFTTIHPVALTVPADRELGAALKAVKEQLRGIPHDGIGYGVLTQFNEHVLPKAEILFNYLGQFDAGRETGDDFTFASESTYSDVSLKGVRDHLVDINGAISQGQLSLNWSYSGDCYAAKTIQTLANSYKTHLQQLIVHCQTGQQGVTPSDFPLALVTQATLDALYHQYAGVQDLYPLSPMQQGMLFHTLYEPETGVYFEQMQWTMSHLEPTAFKAAWQHQLERHPILRTAFLANHTLQLVQAHVSLPWREQDWRSLSAEKQQLQLHRLKQQARTQGFDLEKAPLMRFDLIRLDEQRYVFIWHFHHMLLDGWGLPIMLSEVRDSYLAYVQGHLPQLPSLRPYRDYIAWLQQQDHATALHYWQQRLAGFAAPTSLPIITHQTETPSYHDVSYALSAVTTQQLQR
ncbi:MAG: non-ribosomal peptide synthetase, partial [Chloroflexi bacterium]|nr:non-ribosomal peptide synthetase [Chloroflexota bacterium]